MSSQKPLIIDCHGHYTTAPKALENWRNAQIANLNTPELGPKVADLKISDDELRESIETNQLRLMKERGSDLTLLARAPVSWHTTLAISMCLPHGLLFATSCATA